MSSKLAKDAKEANGVGGAAGAGAGAGAGGAGGVPKVFRIGDGTYVGDVRDQPGADEEVVREGHGTMRYADKIVYVGEWRNDKRHGAGTLIWDDGSWAAGRWHADNLVSGKGVWYELDGMIYEGGFRDLMPEGYGECRYENQTAWYKGQFREGKRHGRGTAFTNEGQHYDGDFEADTYHGRGRLRMADGTAYEGEFVSWQYHGSGRITQPNGDAYVGAFRHDKYHGTGTMQYADGTRYEGKWKHGLRHGRGVQTAPDGRRYQGGWKDGKRHGPGSFVELAAGGKERVLENVFYDRGRRVTDADELALLQAEYDARASKDRDAKKQSRKKLDAGAAAAST